MTSALPGPSESQLSAFPLMKKGNTAVHAEPRSTRRKSNLPPSALSAPPREKKSRRHLSAFRFPNFSFSTLRFLHSKPRLSHAMDGGFRRFLLCRKEDDNRPHFLQSRNAKYASCGDWSQSNDGQHCRFLASAYSVAWPPLPPFTIRGALGRRPSGKLFTVAGMILFPVTILSTRPEAPHSRPPHLASRACAVHLLNCLVPLRGPHRREGPRPIRPFRRWPAPRRELLR